MPSSNRARVWRNTRESHVCAKIVIATGALIAVIARNAGLDCDSIAGLEMLDICTRPYDLSRTFMTQDVRTVDYQGPDSAGVPEVDIRSGAR